MRSTWQVLAVPMALGVLFILFVVGWLVKTDRELQTLNELQKEVLDYVVEEKDKYEQLIVEQAKEKLGQSEYKLVAKRGSYYIYAESKYYEVIHLGEGDIGFVDVGEIFE